MHERFVLGKRSVKSFLHTSFQNLVFFLLILFDFFQSNQRWSNASFCRFIFVITLCTSGRERLVSEAVVMKIFDFLFQHSFVLCFLCFLPKLNPLDLRQSLSVSSQIFTRYVPPLLNVFILFSWIFVLFSSFCLCVFVVFGNYSASSCWFFVTPHRLSAFKVSIDTIWLVLQYVFFRFDYQSVLMPKIFGPKIGSWIVTILGFTVKILGRRQSGYHAKGWGTYLGCALSIAKRISSRSQKRASGEFFENLFLMGNKPP